MTISKHSLVAFYSGIAGFLSVQRFLLEDTYHIIPVITLFMACVFIIFRDRFLFVSFSLIGLLTCVDNGGGIYNHTPALLRYFSIFLCLIAFFGDFKNFLKKDICIFLLWVALILFLTLINYNNIIFQPVFHNFLILSFVFIVFVVKAKSLNSSFNYNNVLIPLTVSMIFGEVVNILTIFNITSGYLNYNSLKSIVVYPLIYFLCRKKFSIFFLIFPLTVFVLIFYVTRMILVSLLLVLLVWLFLFLISNFKKFTLVFFSLFLTFFYFQSHVEISNEKLTSYKASNMIFLLLNESDSDFSKFLRNLDPVRYTEMEIFIDRPAFSILFGSGIGSSYVDNDGKFDFVGRDDYAFSDIELNSRRFYNFHDLWSDVGFRFGLMPIAILFLWLFTKYSKLKDRNYEVSAVPLFCFVLLFCAFFTTAGILFIFISLSIIHAQFSPQKTSDI